MPTVRMGVSADSIKAPEPVGEDMYTVRVEGFKPALTSKKTSFNYNPQLKIIQGRNTGGEFSGKNLFENLNSNAGWIQNDFVHACGLEMEKLEDGTLTIPGGFEATNHDDPTTWKYIGPLVGKTLEVYVIKQDYKDDQGQTKTVNKIKYYVCKLPDCNTKYPEVVHSTNLAK